jgi:acyl-CoA thioester hydrolase
MESAAFVHPYRITYSDCTAGNHVYYARYLEILEVARNEFFRAVGLTFQYWQEHDTIFPVIESRLIYRAPARYDDLLQVELRVTQAKRIRLDFGYRILKSATEVIVEGETAHVCTSLDEKPKRLPPELIDRLAPYRAEA